MKSRTSFFNKALFRKDITRFAPLWALYTVGLLLVLLSGGRAPGAYGKFLGDSIAAFGVVNLLYAGIAAQLLFGDLFQARLCNALHAMPMRRETRFVTHTLAGLSFSFVPNLLAALISLLFLDEFWFLAPMWLLGVTLSYLTFFGIAVFCVMCTGSRFAMTAVYAIVNFGAWVAYWFSETIYLPMMWGVKLDELIFAWFSPAYCIAGQKFVQFTSYRFDLYFDRVYEFQGFGDGWLYLSIVTGLGLVFLGIALVLYRRRSLETAGDFMSVKWLRPVFLLTYTLSMGAFLAMFGSIFNDVYLIFLIIGIICGFFTGYMLLDRTIRVFRKRRFVQLAILLAAIALSVWSVKIDLFGIVRWVPEADRVESIQVENGGENLLLTEPEDIEIVLAAHRAFVDGDDHASGQYVNIWLRYTLKSGREVTRKYAVLSHDPDLTALKKKIFSSPEAVFNLIGSWADFKEGVYSISFEDNYGKVTEFHAEEQIDQLLEALYADCEAGALAQGWAFHSDAATKYVEQLTIRSDPEASGSSAKTLYITIYGDAQNVKVALSALLAGK